MRSQADWCNSQYLYVVCISETILDPRGVGLAHSSNLLILPKARDVMPNNLVLHESKGDDAVLDETHIVPVLLAALTSIFKIFLKFLKCACRSAGAEH